MCRPEPAAADSPYSGRVSKRLTRALSASACQPPATTATRLRPRAPRAPGAPLPPPVRSRSRPCSPLRPPRVARSSTACGRPWRASRFPHPVRGGGPTPPGGARGTAAGTVGGGAGRGARDGRRRPVRPCGRGRGYGWRRRGGRGPRHRAPAAGLPPLGSRTRSHGHPRPASAGRRAGAASVGPPPSAAPRPRSPPYAVGRAP